MKNKNKKSEKAANNQLQARLIKACERLKRANEKLKMLDREKSEFIAIASHQFRNPLSSIKWCAEMLMTSDADKKELTEKQQNFLQEIYKNNQRLIELTDNLLRVCQIEKGKVKIEPQFIGLDEVINQTIKKLSDKIKNKELKITFEKSPERLPKISADKGKMERALFNILDNAAVYNYAGGKINISLGLAFKKYRGRMKRYLQCSIFNTGIGIPKNQLKNIFTKFFRANNVLTVNTQGNGLDLFVAKSYIENHGGKIWAESKGEGMGITFHFSMPIDRENRHRKIASS